ncbi:Maf1-pending-prov protein [Capsaspora owczarzaki ATCC 30864]|uniref:Repressor of RNA polymerase III transcription n=1 Tax=Capsaspora owczarzaki (strain ATCC 30864) TaxID=595528 RepID=A0A0D2WUV6_CAPO3|nr:Maf1-pending-prov protein [Capsaspora owczarzaki ATCC 30864]KJE96495.1 Maf1-pending-prov protein [Capsaspora owczarzaki ATCC 30864]|eukprot:XP_004344436.1 Maf1-pending-prov protein [Capsaspora owczarzaki ATCC 30864]
MKILENVNLDALGSSLSVVRGDKRMVGRVESYSCKLAGTDKKQYKQNFTAEYTEPEHILAFSPPQSMSVSPLSQFNELCYESCNRKTLFYLIAVLNSAFPDYDFSTLKSHNFSKERFDMVSNYINSTLSTELQDEWVAIAAKFWSSIDADVALRDCAIYSYVPETDADNPFAEDGNLWSMNYFFYNHKLKRIVFFSCRCLSVTAPCPEDEMASWGEEDEFMEHYEADDEPSSGYYGSNNTGYPVY